jgi:GAF domain-containing protein
VDTIQGLFRTLGDFFQRLQSILWAIGVAGGAIYALYTFQTHSDYPAETRADIYFFALLLLILLSSASLCYIFYLRQQYRKQSEEKEELSTICARQTTFIQEQYEQITEFSERVADLSVTLEELDDEATLLLMDNEYWTNLKRSSRGVDEMIISCLQQSDQDLKARREDCINIVLQACRQNILPDIPIDERRIAFLRYPQTSESFTLVKGLGIAHESRDDVKRRLTKNDGVAARCIQLQQSVYLPDVQNIQEARDKGYVATSSVARFRSIVCTGIWINERAVGVISADCNQPDAFSEADIGVLEHFADKLRLVYSAFPDA